MSASHSPAAAARLAAALAAAPPAFTKAHRADLRQWNKDLVPVETLTLGRLLEHQFSPREDLVFPWLRQGESAMLWAAAGTGKSLLTLAVMVAGGGIVLGWKSPRPRRVLLVDGEVSVEDLQ